MSAKDVLQKHKRELLQKRNVVAVGRGLKIVGGRSTNTEAIICSVVVKIPMSSDLLAPKDIIPRLIDGIPTDVVESDVLEALREPKAAAAGRTDKHRPAPGGVSIGHHLITAGTLGCLVVRNGQVYILSNNHVLANSNGADSGDDILQPGSYDGGSQPDDVIAHLAEFVPIIFEGDTPPPPSCPVARIVAGALNIPARALRRSTRLVAVQQSVNLVDAAIAKPLRDDDVAREILEIGRITGVSEAHLGMNVNKSGRTTELTAGTITQVDVTARVRYGGDRTALFEDQLMAGEMSQGGDSGSVVLDVDDNIVGLLFAGSDSTTVISRIQNVFELLNIEVYY